MNLCRMSDTEAPKRELQRHTCAAQRLKFIQHTQKQGNTQLRQKQPFFLSSDLNERVYALQMRLSPLFLSSLLNCPKRLFPKGISMPETAVSKGDFGARNGCFQRGFRCPKQLFPKGISVPETAVSKRDFDARNGCFQKGFR